MELLFPLPVWIVTLALCLLHAYRSPRVDHVAAIVKAFALSVLWTVAAVAAFWGCVFLFALLIETEKGIIVAIAAWPILYIAVALAAFGRRKAAMSVAKFSNGDAAQATQPPRPTKPDTIEMSEQCAACDQPYAAFLHPTCPFCGYDNTMGQSPGKDQKTRGGESEAINVRKFIESEPWQAVVSPPVKQGLGWLLTTKYTTATWPYEILPGDPHSVYLKRSQNGRYIAAGIYDRNGQVHQDGVPRPPPPSAEARAIMVKWREARIDGRLLLKMRRTGRAAHALGRAVIIVWRYADRHPVALLLVKSVGYLAIIFMAGMVYLHSGDIAHWTAKFR